MGGGSVAIVRGQQRCGGRGNEIVHALTVFAARAWNNVQLIHAPFHAGKHWRPAPQTPPVLVRCDEIMPRGRSVSGQEPERSSAITGERLVRAAGAPASGKCARSKSRGR